MGKPAYLTISVDDGHPTDLRTAELLQRYGLKATFYIPARNPEREVIPEQEVRRLAERFEIGGHTFNHLPLRWMPTDQARREICDGKSWLEGVIGAPVSAFCYPRGKFTSETVRLVEQAGFAGARTCFQNLNHAPKNRYLWGVSTHAYSHTRAIQIRHAVLERNFRGLASFVLVHRLARDWELHFENAVGDVERNGGIAHLYFHSWEIDEHGQWDKLTRVLARLAERTSLTRVTNGELFAMRNPP